MPTCRAVITRCLRKARVYAAGEVPSSEDMEDGMEELKGLYAGWATNGMFGRIYDVQTDSDYEAGPWERITVTESATITIPTSFEDDGENLPPYDMAYIEVVDLENQTVSRYLYSNGGWVDINALGLDDEAPLADRGIGGLSACLALTFAEEFGEVAGPAIQRQAAAFKMGLSLKLGSDAPRTAADYF